MASTATFIRHPSSLFRSIIFELNAKSKSNSMYALNYLAEISKAITSDSIVIQFSTNKPMHMEFAIAEGGRISFILAPRVERR
jgi:proliferating cell nuclear antigen